MQEIIQLKVYLIHSDPLIWRQIQVSRETSFFELHHIIQITMGWSNYHMFEFDLEGYRIGDIIEDEKSDGYGCDQLMDSREVILKDLITQSTDVINYLYDFGDGWKHRITVESFLAIDPSIKYPICVGGQMNCPPEDCGGTYSFYESLQILKDKKHSEYKDVSEWFGRKYNPVQFNKEKVNKRLIKLEDYIHKWLNGD